jgi:subtilisin family serine protease
MSFGFNFNTGLPALGRVSGAINIAIIAGLVLSEVLLSAPFAVATSAAEVAASQSEPAAELAPHRARKRTGRDEHDKRKGHSKRQKPKRDHDQGKRKDANGKHKGAKGKKKDRQRDHPKKNRNRKQKAPRLHTGVLPAAASVAAPANQPVSAEDRYIVVLKDQARGAADGGDTSAMGVASEIASADPGVVPTHVYEHVFDGFAAVIPDDQLAAVRNDPRVEAVVPDGVVYGEVQTLPTGINRINADLDPRARIDGIDQRIDVDVAVLDTAFHPFHADINEWATANCTDTPVATDDHGHGTHVSGTIGALDNDFGVVGVAPGARIWTVRVLKAAAGGGSTGLNSWIICGLDLVTRYANDQGDGLGTIEVANLSLSGPGTNGTCADPYQAAYCRAHAAGVTVVVAAGNDAVDASTRVPAAFVNEVITVSALADSDGRSGGFGPPTPKGADDSLATFSNFGGAIDIAAPGVAILSTVPDGACAMCDPTGYRVADGTSMAAPHVAGAAALYLAAHPGAAPAQVRTALLDSRELIAGINEGVLNLTARGGVGPPPAPAPDESVSASQSNRDKKRKNRKNRKNRKKG